MERPRKQINTCIDNGNVNMDEKELIEQGYKKETLCVHLQEYDPRTIEDVEIPFRRLSYDLSNDFTYNQIAIIRNWVKEVNDRFPNIKMYVTGTGYYKPEE